MSVLPLWRSSEITNCYLLLVTFIGRVPVAEEKIKKAKQCLVFRGNRIVKMETRLPLDKFIKCRELVKYIIGRKNIEIKEIQSVIGLLNFACQVVVPERAFLRRLINLTIGIRRPCHKVYLNKTALAYLAAFELLHRNFNGKVILGRF